MRMVAYLHYRLAQVKQYCAKNASLCKKRVQNDAAQCVAYMWQWFQAAIAVQRLTMV
jgi:hypothetical protein